MILNPHPRDGDRFQLTPKLGLPAFDLPGQKDLGQDASVGPGRRRGSHRPRRREQSAAGGEKADQDQATGMRLE